MEKQIQIIKSNCHCWKSLNMSNRIDQGFVPFNQIKDILINGESQKTHHKLLPLKRQFALKDTEGNMEWHHIHRRGLSVSQDYLVDTNALIKYFEEKINV